MKLMKKDIRPNEQITTFFALESMQIRKSKKTLQNYLVVTLHDKSGNITAYLWNDPLETAATLQEKSFVKVKGLTTLLNGSLIINIERIRKAEKHEIDLRDFLEVVSGGVDFWHRRLLGYVEIIKDKNCKWLINELRVYGTLSNVTGRHLDPS